MFAVSGMHIVIFGQMVVLLLTFLGVRRRRAPAYALIVVWLFIGICGFPFSSSLRAGIMFSIYALGLVFFEPGRTQMNSLGISLLLICLPNAFCAMDVGLLLSAAGYARHSFTLASHHRFSLPFCSQKPLGWRPFCVRPTT